MDTYDPETVFSSIDSWGRLRLRQPTSIAGWNLARFAEALLPLLAEDQEQAVDLAQESLGGFGPQSQTALATGMRSKLGLSETVADEVATPLMNDLLALLATSHVDFTSFFRNLGRAARARPNRPAACSSTSRASTNGWTVACSGPGRRHHGPGQPRLHPEEPPRRGGAGRGDRRRPGSARRAPGSRQRALRRTSRPRAIRRPRTRGLR